MNLPNVRSPEKKRCSILSALSLPALLCLGLLLQACDQGNDSASRRAIHAKTSQGDIVVAVTLTSATRDKSFINGVKLAAEHFNDKGGLSGRKITPVIIAGSSNVEANLQAAEKAAADINTIAVISRHAKETLLPSSILYQFHGIIFFNAAPRVVFDASPQAFPFFFNISPYAADIAREIALYCTRGKYKKVILIADQDEYHQEIARQLETKTTLQHIRIQAEYTLLSETDDEKEQENDNLTRILSESGADSIIVLADEDGVTTVAQVLQEIDSTLPIITSMENQSRKIEHDIKRKIINLSLVSQDEENLSKTFRTFAKAYEEKFSTSPDTSAVIGYFSMEQLSKAIQKAESVVPEDIAGVLNNGKEKESLFGKFYFDNRGNAYHNLTVDLL
jgi:ABC-type branched-subunit amino acid transport system substrate-binding protein